MTRLYLVRHAQSAPSPDVPDAQWPLSERGRAQSHALVAILQTFGIGRIRSSPYARALDTIRPFARAADLDIEVDPRLRERKLSVGMVDDFQALVARSWRDFDFHLPDCESFRMCQERVRAAVSECLAEPQIHVLSCHGNAISLYLHSIDSSFGHPQWQSMGNPDLFCITKNGDELTWKRVAI